MKQIRQFMLAVLVALASIATMHAHEFEAVNADGKTIYYLVPSENTCWVTFRGDYSDSFSNEYSGDIVIPSSVKYKGKEYTVTAIGPGTFDGCSGLTGVIIPESVKYIMGRAFQGCNNLPTYDGVRYAGSCAVGPVNKSSISTCSLKEGTRFIDGYAFWACSKLTSITIPEGVTSIGLNAFADCSSLTSIIIPEGVTSIGSQAFRECSSLTSIIIPKSVTSIDTQAFEYCRNLTEFISLRPTPPSASWSAFQTYSEEPVLKVPVGSVEVYQKATGWRTFKNIEELDVSEIELDENFEYLLKENKPFCTVTYTRTFNNTALQPLYIPFSMSYSDWCEDFEVYRINMFSEHDTDDDGIADETVMEIIKVKEGNGALRANYPYLIRAKEAGEKTITVEDATLHAAEANSIDCSTVDTKYTFTGTYQKMTGLKSAGYYGMSGGSLCLVDNDMVELGAFRWYLKVEPRGSQFMPASAPRSIKVRIAGEDEQGEATGIAGTEGNGQGIARAAEGCYNLQGMRVGSDYRGIVIKNGKKMIVK